MYVSFLAGCFRSVRFGLEEAHGKGQALQFNWLFEKGAFVLHPDETFTVDFDKVEGVVESLSREILTVQAKGDKEAAKNLLQKYCEMTQPLKLALAKLERVQLWFIGSLVHASEILSSSTISSSTRSNGDFTQTQEFEDKLTERVEKMRDEVTAQLQSTYEAKFEQLKNDFQMQFQEMRNSRT